MVIFFPSEENNLTGFLKKKLRFNLNDFFNGRFLNLTLTENIDNNDNITTAQALVFRGKRPYGPLNYGLFYANLNFLKIPSPIEYNRLSSPLSTIFFNHFLIRDSDVERVDYRTITNVNERILEAIGIKYILYNSKPRNSKLIEKTPVPSSTNYNLYEFNNPNIGQYSPTNLFYDTDIFSIIKKKKKIILTSLKMLLFMINYLRFNLKK